MTEFILEHKTNLVIGLVVFYFGIILFITQVKYLLFCDLLKKKNIFPSNKNSFFKGKHTGHWRPSPGSGVTFRTPVPIKLDFADPELIKKAKSYNFMVWLIWVSMGLAILSGIIYYKYLH